MAVPKISLMICGTRLSTGGWEPLILLNNPPFPMLSNIGLGGFGENPVYYTFRIDREYTQFTLVYSPRYIKANQASRDGALKVSISIPRGHKIKDSNPYDVLASLRKVLEEVALSPIIGREGAFEFKPTFPPEVIFAKELDKFTLVEEEMPHRQMSSTSNEVGFIPADIAKMKLLFEDVQYPEFEPYKEIAVAQLGESEHVIKNLDIPRKPKYEIVANNTNITPSLRKTYNYGYTDEILIDVLSLLKLSNKEYERTVFEFTVQEALDGRAPISVQVDKKREIIKLILPTPRKLKRRLLITIEGVNKPDLFKYLKVIVGGRIHSLAGNCLELIGQEISLINHIDVRVEGDKYKMNGSHRIEGDTIIVPIKEIEKPKKVQNWGVSEHLQDTVDRNDLIRFNLFLCAEDAIENKNSLCKVKFKSESFTFTLKCFFEKAKNTGFKTEIVIPLKWANDYKLTLETDCAKIDDSKAIDCAIRPKMKDIQVTADELTPRSWYEKLPLSKRKLIHYLLGFIIGVVLSFTLVWLYGIFFASSSVTQRGSGDNGENSIVPYSNNVGATSGDPNYQRVQDYVSRLQEDDVKFDEIRQMNQWVTENESKLQEKGVSLKGKLEGYMEVISVLQDPKKRKVGDIKEVTEKNAASLYPSHLQKLKNVWIKELNSRGKPVVVNPQEESKVNEALGTEKIGSFLEVPASADILGGSQVSSRTNSSSSNTSSSNNSSSSIKGTSKPESSGNTNKPEEDKPRW